ncbi:hypothetical protein [Rathayibacter agropyri]|uniref:hypothetical protein n=1 Tax=Rathayibacter agropyri TaxID=1634927 RepID=UPI001565F9C6|nr:hypothetical protein [Rathayibacter agropyri]NRD08832.1 hypothetical protein [Rathayibacter agropyri]
MHRFFRTRPVLGTAGIALSLVFVAPAASAAPNHIDRICEDEYQGGCAHWYTGDSTCDHIYETSAPEYRKKACTIWVSTGKMYIER